MRCNPGWPGPAGDAAPALIFLAVLVAPFRVRAVEQNPEIFLFACGVAVLTRAGFLSIPGEETGWTEGIIGEALTASLPIGDRFGIPVGIVQIVLLVGVVIHVWHRPIHEGIGRVVPRVPGDVRGPCRAPGGTGRIVPPVPYH